MSAESRRYTAEHAWFQLEGDTGRIGITQYAVDALGDLVWVELPDVGVHVEEGVPCGEVESTKTVSDVISPVSGTVVEVNQALTESPSTLSEDPYGAGWLIIVRIDSIGDTLDEADYAAITG